MHKLKCKTFYLGKQLSMRKFAETNPKKQDEESTYLFGLLATYLH